MIIVLMVAVGIVCVALGIVAALEVKEDKAMMSDVAAIRQRLEDAQSELLDVRFGVKNLEAIAKMNGLCERVCFFQYKGSQPSGFSAGGDAYVVSTSAVLHVFDMNGTDCGLFDDFDKITLKKTHRSSIAVLEARLSDLRERESELNDFIVFLQKNLNAAMS